MPKSAHGTQILLSGLLQYIAIAVQQSNIAALRADIEQGMADVRAGHVAEMDMGAIKAQGRALKKSS